MSTRLQKKKRGGEPRALAELMSRAYPAREPDEAALIRAYSWWQKAVPERVVARARPVRLVHGTLVVHTATSAWALELDHLRETLLASVQKHAPFARVREIRFRVGPLPDVPQRTREEPRRPSPVAVANLPDELARALATIDDDELRDAIGHAASIALGRNGHE